MKLKTDDEPHFSETLAKVVEHKPMTGAWPILALSLVACGNAQDDRPAATEVVAQRFMANPQPPAPTPELQEQITFLDECTVKLIRASDITYETPEEAITDKVREFMRQCETELHARLDQEQLRPR